MPIIHLVATMLMQTIAPLTNDKNSMKDLTKFFLLANRYAQSLSLAFYY